MQHLLASIYDSRARHWKETVQWQRKYLVAGVVRGPVSIDSGQWRAGMRPAAAAGVLIFQGSDFRSDCVDM